MILTAEVGEGHVAAARALALELSSWRADVEVLVCDALAGLGRPLRWILLDGYRYQLRAAPWAFGLLYRLFASFPPLRWLGRVGLAVLGGRSLLRLLRRHRPDVVVSTYPAATSVVGDLRRRGRLRVPACATATDLAGLEFWAHPGIDLHLVMHESCVAPVERLVGLGRVRRVQPLVDRAFFEQRAPEQARRRLCLPLGKPVVVVSGGGWGVGDLEGAVRACLELPGSTVVCVTGRNKQRYNHLRSHFVHQPRVRVLGFTDQMNDLLAAADAVVHSTGGVTCLEALVRRCPIVAYGAPPGHAPRTARAMASLGLLEAASSQAGLVAALRRALAQPLAERPRLAPGPAAAPLILAAQPQHSTSFFSRAAPLRFAAAAAVAVVLGGWAFLSDDAFPMVAEALDLEPISHISTVQSKVALVIRAPATLDAGLAAVLQQRGAEASFAFTRTPGRRALRALAAEGDEPLPELRPGGLTNWFDTKGELRHDAQALGSSARYYLAPTSGFTLSQELLGRDIGAHPIVGSVRINSAGSLGAVRELVRGDVVVLTLAPPQKGAVHVLDQVLDRVAGRNLRAVSLGELVKAGQR